jgi:hypothetical protein
MVRASVDLKFLVPLDIFGSEDLRLYSEAAILGVKNYPASRNNPYGYDTLRYKIPVVLGFTVPAFKLLDVVALEAEWYGGRYPDSYYKVFIKGLPLPGSRQTTGTPRDYINDNWKWSIYVKRSFLDRCSIMAQAARDHTRWETSPSLAMNFDREEALNKPEHWYWTVKALFRF